ncbi:MAG: alpha/beta fold hydrolase [Paracoccaceae bacterium]
MTDLLPLPLPQGIRSRMVATDTGLNQHILEAGEAGRPMLLLLHGFPELAFSWRKVMVPLAEAGFHVVAPDQRGYGRTSGWDGAYDGDLSAYAMPCLVRDAVALIRALDVEQAFAVIGHDFGSPVSAWSTLLRPDIFPRLVCLSAPFGGPPKIAVDEDPVHADLLTLTPPRKHYQQYYATRPAAADMLDAPQGLHAFLRAYFHMKSADWVPNAPHTLDGWTAGELAKMPTYYVMQADQNMAETVAPHDPGKGAPWMTDAEMAVYAAEYQRTGLQAALNWYRCATSPRFRRDLSVFHGRRIEVPAMFIAGKQDWGWAQVPGALEAMETTATTDLRGTHLVERAGHWVQQEQPAEVTRLIRDFLAST